MSDLAIKARANRISALDTLATRDERTSRPNEEQGKLGGWMRAFAGVFEVTPARA